MKFPLSVLLGGALLMAGASLSAKDTATFHEKGYDLTFNNDDPGLDPKLKARMVQTFFIVYPEEARDFNPGAAKSVTFSIEPSYHGVAATGGSAIHFSADYLRQHPQDIDVITHETMHVVQAYKGGVPGWLTEGIADYARYKYGVDNAGGDWSLPDYQAGQKYTDAYRVTARFLAWLEKHKKAGIVKTLDAALRGGTYTPDTWKQAAGKSLDDLWQEYTVNPAL